MMFDLYSPIGDSHTEDYRYPWIGNLLIAVVLASICSGVYWWGTA